MRWKWKSIRRGEVIKSSWMKHSVASYSAVVPAKAGTHTPCPLDVAWQMKYRKRGGYGSPPSRGRQRRGFAYSRQPEQLLRVAMADLLLVGLRQANRLQHLDGVADVARALLLVERTIGREQRVIGREEIDPADGGGACA